MLHMQVRRHALHGHRQNKATQYQSWSHKKYKSEKVGNTIALPTFLYFYGSYPPSAPTGRCQARSIKQHMHGAGAAVFFIALRIGLYRGQLRQPAAQG